MKKVFKITNNYIILATVLILYSLISNVYAACFMAGGGVKLIGLIFAMVLLLLMTTAFLAGWFKMVKYAAMEKDFSEPNSLIKLFPEGVGEYLLPIFGMGIVVTIVFTLIGVGFFFLGSHVVGNPDIDWKAFAEASRNIEGMKSFLLSLPPEQVTKLALWNQLFLIGLMISYFVIFIYPPVVFFKNKNPFIAFFISIKDLFNKKFFKTLGIFLLIVFCNSLISVLNVLTASNIVLGLLTTLAGFYILTASTVGTFYYYYTELMNLHLGQNVDVKV